MPIPSRGLKHLRTPLSGGSGGAILPEKAYQRLARIMLDRKRAMDRMADAIDVLQEIESEKAVLLKGLELKGPEEGSPNLQPQTQPGPRRSCGGFKIRY